MSVIEKLLHRMPHDDAVPEPYPPGPDTRGMQAALGLPVQDEYEGFAEMTIAQPSAQPPAWAPECGTPCYSTRHHHPAIGDR
jgi:hypothetical protein